MSLIRKYDKTLRRRVALRAVWLPGTEVNVGYWLGPWSKHCPQNCEAPPLGSYKELVLHKIWRAEDFSFLGNLEGSSEITFSGKGDLIKNLINNGISSGLSINGGHSMNLEVMGKSGPIVMQVFRVKRNGEIF